MCRQSRADCICEIKFLRMNTFYFFYSENAFLRNCLYIKEEIQELTIREIIREKFIRLNELIVIYFCPYSLTLQS